MPCPLPSDFQSLIVDAQAPACDQLRKLGRLAETVSNAYACIYDEDGSFTEEFAARICATGCGSSASTSTGGSTTSTTTTPSSTSPQDYGDPGSHVFTVPAGVTEVTVTVIAGGGSGGRAGGPFSPATTHSGGGSGEQRIRTFAVTPGSTLNVTVGAGSAGPNGAGAPGGQSQVSYFAVTTLARGGGGGLAGPWGYASPPIPPLPGGAGGTGGSGGSGTPGNAGSPNAAYPTYVNGSGGASVGLGAGAGSAGSSNGSVPNPGGNGFVRIAW